MSNPDTRDPLDDVIPTDTSDPWSDDGADTSGEEEIGPATWQPSTEPALLTVSIPGAPVAKGRPRAVRIGDGVRMITPDKTRHWESAAAMFARSAWRNLPALEVPVEVRVLAVYPRPVATSKRAPERRWRPCKPDIDNVIKAALDALTLAGVVVDDSLAVRVSGESVYAALGEQAHVEIKVFPIGRVPE